MQTTPTTPKDKVMVPVIIGLSVVVPIVVIILMNLGWRIRIPIHL